MTLQTVILAFGLVIVIEGLVFALAPRRLDDLLRAMADLPLEARRAIGVLAIIAGLVVIVIATRMSGA